MVMNDHKCAMGEICTTLDVVADAQDIYHELSFMEFLKLMDCGGFELLQVPEGGKNLNVIISSESDYT